MSIGSKDYHDIYMENIQQKETIDNLQHQLTRICKYESHQNAPNFEKMKTKETTTAKKVGIKQIFTKITNFQVNSKKVLKTRRNQTFE